jgi:predicted metal-dependent hydrolase
VGLQTEIPLGGLDMNSQNTSKEKSYSNHKELVEKILAEYMSQLGIGEEVKVKLKNYKVRSAFCNLRTRTIYLNSILVDLGEEAIRYLLLHELIHIKQGNRYHNDEFYRLLYKFISPEKVDAVRERIIEALYNNGTQT